MKVFIIGKYNTFTNALIQKLHEKNDIVYVLTEEKYYGKKPQNVFEQYNFSYSSDKVTEVLDSVCPDVILFTGAYDSNFQWFKIRDESMHYLSGLMNIILSAKNLTVKNFIYLSSHQVYNHHSESLISTDTKTTANDYAGIAIAQGEDLCRHFNETTDLDIHILRVDHLYKTPKNLEDVTDICSRLCLEAVKKGTVTINENLIFSMINLPDAVLGIYDFIHGKNFEHFIYHLSTSEAITELKIAEMICSVDSFVVLKDETVGEKQKVLLDNTAFLNDFGLKIFHSYEKTIPEIYRAIKQNEENFITETKKKKSRDHKLMNRLKPLSQAMPPFIENCIIFILVFIISNYTTGSQYFDKLDFSLLYVLLFAGIYGTKQSVFSAALSVIGYFFRQFYYHTGTEVLVDYNTCFWVAQLFIIALAVGRLRDSLITISYDKEKEIHFLNSRLENLTDINESNIRIRNIYQNRVLDYNDSLVKIYGITSALDSLESGSVLFYAADIIGHILGTDDVAIYQITDEDYCRLFSATSKQAKSLGKSVKYSAMAEMMEAVNNGQVYMNKTMNEDYPQMASAIFRDGRPIELIMLWGLPFENMTVYHSNLLTVLGCMIYNSVERADRYLNELSTTRFITGTQLLTKDAFEELHNICQDAMEKGLTEYVILSASCRYAMTYKQWSQKLSSKLRSSDYIGIDKQNRICILLTNSNIEDAQFIVQLFAEMDIVCTLV